jgi:hypothetical protein
MQCVQFTLIVTEIHHVWQAIIFGSVTGLTMIIVMAATKCFGHC